MVAALATHHGSWAGAEPVGIEMLHAGVPVEPPLVELYASPEPAALELVAGGAGVGSVSVSVVRSSNWGAADAPPPAAPALADHGGGEATLTVDRSSPGELVIEAAASGDSGEARALYVVRVLDALPPPGGHDGAAPSRIVGGVDSDDPALPRILAQAGRPLCADTTYASDGAVPLEDRRPHDGNNVYMSPTHGPVRWESRPTLSGVPPIEGVGAFRDIRAVFGQQVPQWVYLDRIGDPRRDHYYVQYEAALGIPEPIGLKNPYTNKKETFPTSATLPSAAAPGPYWGGASQAGSLHRLGVNLYFGINGTVHFVTTSVNATNSFVPEILPLDGTVAILATAFHDDIVRFSVPGPYDPAAVDAGRHLPLKRPQGATHALVNGTEVPLGRGLSATVRVSDIARLNGVLIEGISDAEGAGGMAVKKLHEVTLVAEIPVNAGDVGAYELVRQGMSVAPWECWPLLGGNALVP